MAPPVRRTRLLSSSPCTANGACASEGGPGECKFEGNGPSGVCGLRTQYRAHAALGDACSSSCVRLDECTVSGSDSIDTACYADDGLFCSPERTCAPLGVAEASCRTTRDCASGLWCTVNAQEARPPRVPEPVGVCKPTLDNGNSCTDPEQCTSKACNGACFHAPLATPRSCSGKLKKTATFDQTPKTTSSRGRLSRHVPLSTRQLRGLKIPNRRAVDLR
jgi:hypothetical protein